eukprot:CAMPEP_0185567376 /NCGR_PEP_ID=MMETSP0434-20130131/666_1 /TAXON_ID=626734 ORGANISM="Favella taraikaensis, Strain Fe Narragansett Bay" /NCGR_SAMPLE_ID=MMETSP0434 /ASSEMBLY_ACC=CAM_ASM_000379 /LENGTH=53 /DNA_ID=CAMNT_0028181593 /DNA_START=722 /DNA_END=883 /DNA_ORIENTATION=+
MVKLTKLNLYELEGLQQNEELVVSICDLLRNPGMGDLEELSLENCGLTGTELT